MKPKLSCLFLLLSTFNFCKVQEPVGLDTSMFEKKTINLFRGFGWIFHKGIDAKKAAKNIDTIGWLHLPTGLTVKHADKSGREEG